MRPHQELVFQAYYLYQPDEVKVMMENVLTKAWKRLKKLVDYNPPTTPDSFVLDEARPYDSRIPGERQADAGETERSRLAGMVAFARLVAGFMEKTRQAVREGDLAGRSDGFRAELAALERQWAALSPLVFAYEQGLEADEGILNTSLDENRRRLEIIYRLPRNKDVVVREFEVGDHGAAAVAVYIEGLVDGAKLDRFVLEPLMTVRGRVYAEDMVERLIKTVIPNGQVSRATDFKSLQEGVNVGDTAVIIDGIGEAIIIETKGWEHRGVDSPKTEQTVRGSLAGFSENLRVNTGLVRSVLRSSDLVTELVKVGKRGELNCAIMYMDSIANASLVAEVRRRIEGIVTDYVSDSSELVQFIEDDPTSLFPQTMSTERPDRVASHLAEGRVALIMEGNPFAQILPVSFFSFFHSAEDFSVKSGVANFMRSLRLFGALISTVLPSLYLAISYFHPEALPSELLLAVAGSREHVPFPAWFEVLVMEISFELVREAGVRIPGLLASTIGIVGAIILGQAAVAAKIVSPIVVVVVAITGLASFTIPEYRMASAVRLIRFVLFIVASTWGLVGLAMALLTLTAVLCGMKSFGMPYMVPVGPRTMANYDVVMRGQVFNQEARPDALNTKDSRRQPTVSRVWTKKPPKGERNE